MDNLNGYPFFVEYTFTNTYFYVYIKNKFF